MLCLIDWQTFTDIPEALATSTVGATNDHTQHPNHRDRKHL